MINYDIDFNALKTPYVTSSYRFYTSKVKWFALKLFKVMILLPYG